MVRSRREAPAARRSWTNLLSELETNDQDNRCEYGYKQILCHGCPGFRKESGEVCATKIEGCTACPEQCTPQKCRETRSRHCSTSAMLPVAQPRDGGKLNTAVPTRVCPHARERDRLADVETQRLGLRLGVDDCGENRALNARSRIQHKSRLKNLRLEFFDLIV